MVVTLKSHPREWVVRSDPFYQTPFIVVTLKSHPREWVVRSDPFYQTPFLPLVGLSISRRCKLDRKDLNVSTHSRGWYFEFLCIAARGQSHPRVMPLRG